MTRTFILTSESVSEGHPDKVCDIISDTLVDLYLAADPRARTAFEALAMRDTVIVAGERWMPESGHVVTDEEIEKATRSAIRDIGYDTGPFNWRTVNVMQSIQEQSPDIRNGIGDDGAGDQGIMFGYATDETPEYLPAGLVMAHRIVRTLANARRGELAGKLGPDAKSQVSMVYQDHVPVRIDSLVVSTQHAQTLSCSKVRELILSLISTAIGEQWMPPDQHIHVNPAGRFVTGGPEGDTGLTGRKIIIDTYGGAAPHGGGAFSGKDASKVDRSAAYACRYLARNIVAARLARRCTLQVSYGIGMTEPLSVYVDTHGTGSVSDQQLEMAVREVMDLSPRGIRDHLALDRPIYARTASYGHFGRAPERDGCFSWEKEDLVEDLTKLL